MINKNNSQLFRTVPVIKLLSLSFKTHSYLFCFVMQGLGLYKPHFSFASCFLLGSVYKGHSREVSGLGEEQVGFLLLSSGPSKTVTSSLQQSQYISEAACYGLNCVPLKFIYCILTPSTSACER